MIKHSVLAKELGYKFLETPINAFDLHGNSDQNWDKPNEKEIQIREASVMFSANFV